MSKLDALTVRANNFMNFLKQNQNRSRRPLTGLKDVY